jgi:hypothetical protein
MPKTRSELQAQIDLDARLKEERQASDAAYAERIVQTIVFGFLGILATAIITGLVTLAIKHIK